MSAFECSFNRSSQHFSILLKWSEQMRRRIYYSTEQRAEIWDRWKRGESAHEIGRLFDRPHSSIFKILMKTGGLRPPERKRSRLSLTLAAVSYTHLTLPTIYSV